MCRWERRLSAQDRDAARHHGHSKKKKKSALTVRPARQGSRQQEEVEESNTDEASVRRTATRQLISDLMASPRAVRACGVIETLGTSNVQRSVRPRGGSSSLTAEARTTGAEKKCSRRIRHIESGTQLKHAEREGLRLQRMRGQGTSWLWRSAMAEADTAAAAGVGLSCCSCDSWSARRMCTSSRTWMSRTGSGTRSGISQ